MVAKMRVVVVLCFIAAFSLGVKGFPTSTETAEDEQPKEDKSAQFNCSPCMKMLHELLQKLGCMPEHQSNSVATTHSNSTTEGPDAFSVNMTADDALFNEAIEKTFKWASERYPIPHHRGGNKPSFNFPHPPPLIHHEHREPNAQPFNSLRRYIQSLGYDLLPGHQSPAHTNFHTVRSPVSFDSKDKELSIHLNTKIDLQKTSHLGPIIVNNNIEVLMSKDEEEGNPEADAKPEKEVPKPAEPVYDYDAETEDDEYYFDDNEGGSGSHHAPHLDVDKEKEAEAIVMTTEQTEVVDMGTTLI